jgi:protein SCO1/2
MWSHRGLFLKTVLCAYLASTFAEAALEPPSSSNQSEGDVRFFAMKGVVRKIGPDSRTVVIQHEAVAGYMPAMTMPFKVQEPNQMAGLRAGDCISFRLSVTNTESWIDQITKVGAIPVAEGGLSVEAPATQDEGSRPRHPLLKFKFTNELGRPVSLGDFRGQAIAITFFFTRCPIPDYCPRLSKNFQEAAKKLHAIPGGPTNWHFLSVSFDSEFDKPSVLKAYGERYHYDPTHWSFLTGPAEQITQLARLSDVTFEREGGTFNHNFRTLIIDATGHLQTVFPTGGDLAEAIVAEILKAAAAEIKSVSGNATQTPQNGVNQKIQDPSFQLKLAPSTAVADAAKCLTKRSL